MLARFRVFDIVSGNYLNKRAENIILFLKFLTSTYSGTERQMWAAINRKLPVLMERDAENERMRQKRAELKTLSVRRK